ncbi:hypothetical protein CaCOL14_002527 [Colletotrichum acutatum]|uniref:Ubiquitin-conjugating enzyme E2-binding protein n=1 Tax=Glomerella acutata TaxID=27357 RepID=A0AAD8XL04_GLOAC|nr:ubiquitin-conjugating enzyme E2-binding protein [Colletotrichum acutatum]KAK1729239.1 ubiquitin-conjugating enzyme E2-binding protein [Colletotrichum acutatum]
MSSHDTPTIYAELLTNIRQLSVAVTLPSPAGGQTKALIAPDGATLHIHHAGTETSFPLPGRVLAQAGAPTALPLPPRPPSASSSSAAAPASQTLSWRLPLADSPAARSSTSPADDPVPWTARDLLPGSVVACRRCAAVVVPGGKTREWKDLPSENWAEMMDFWHCHKPSTNHEDEHEHGANGEGKGHGKEDHEHLTRRGYGANSSIAAQPGVGMVDLTSFLFCEADCVGLKFSLPSSDAVPQASSSSEVLAGGGVGDSDSASDPTPPPRMLNIACFACASHLGFFNVAISSVVLLKWQVSCQTITSRPTAVAEAAALPSSTDCLAATLIATLSRSGSSKSVVVPAFQSTQNLVSSSSDGGEAVPPALHLWILNSNITYASSSFSSSSPSSPAASYQRNKRAAIKLLYKEISQDEADDMLESMTSDVQEVNLPLPAIVAAAEGLKRSSELLPPVERGFKGWHVGLMDKWELAS